MTVSSGVVHPAAEDPFDRLPVVRERLVGLVFDGLEDALHGFQDAVRALGQAGVEADAEQGEPLVDDQVVLFDGEPDARGLVQGAAWFEGDAGADGEDVDLPVEGLVGLAAGQGEVRGAFGERLEDGEDGAGGLFALLPGGGVADGRLAGKEHVQPCAARGGADESVADVPAERADLPDDALSCCHARRLCGVARTACPG